MADRKLEGPGSEERLKAVRKGFRRTSQRLHGRSKLAAWAAMGRTFFVWFAGLALFALATLLITDALL
ncbi:hypothetical protein CQ035_11070 [Brevundimonas sp. MYb46]|nr:hypothetical protein CQ026_12120 [Brevundimonas sp. MYb31]PRA36548.1 hypothetical protein CQ024_00090 [Brevundimonas sp. MYb27]PRB13592.1 hypothetical protein CQ039_12415 [Brevundimonas sp. MYb52]PRB34192.1 hypothetical protein CQ035_11070 [Brevundimonas sp. MYb46]PRB46586.1 hypothetical protein CQ028_11200 [Brevundimonas sp. MYb33]